MPVFEESADEEYQQMQSNMKRTVSSDGNVSHDSGCELVRELRVNVLVFPYVGRRCKSVLRRRWNRDGDRRSSSYSGRL